MPLTLKGVLVAVALCGVAHADRIIVGGDKGVFEIDESGAIVRTLSKRAATMPRWSADRSRIFYLTKRELRAVTLDGVTDVAVGKLPRSVNVCASEEEAARRVKLDDLAPQSDDDFSVDAATACVSMKDRNLNMLNVDIHVRVELATGTVKSGVFFPKCAGSTSPCDPSIAGVKDSDSPAAPFDVKDGHLVRDGKRVLDLGDFAIATVSPSGRWALLRGNEEDGDYIHFAAFLLDRQDGALYAIGDGSAARSKKLRKLTDGERRRVRRPNAVHTADLVGETALFWIGERLVLGRQLVAPLEGIVDLPGDVAR